MKIKTGDTVQVISGKSVDQTGEVQKVLTDEGRIVVEGINITKRHKRATQRTEEGGIIERPAPIDVSNVKLVCPKCKLPFLMKKFDKEGNITLVCSEKTCGHKQSGVADA